MEQEKAPGWAEKALREKFLKDIDHVCSNTICGCPNCKNEARDIACWWEMPLPSVAEAKNMREVIVNKIFEINGKRNTTPSGNNTIPDGGDTASPDDPKFRL